MFQKAISSSRKYNTVPINKQRKGMALTFKEYLNYVNKEMFNIAGKEQLPQPI